MAEWHEGKEEFFKSLKNTETYRVLVALVINTLSPFAKPWRERMLFQADALKPANQVACSEFVGKRTSTIDFDGWLRFFCTSVKAALQSADLLGFEKAQTSEHVSFLTIGLVQKTA